MNVLWLAPAAWVGVALVVVPVLIHLLARQHSRRVLFPSLRFLPASQLAALRRRTIADWPLLILRMLIVAAAVAAVAAPVFVSEARRAAWDTRLARALILAEDGADVDALAEEAAQETFTTARFSEPVLADAMRSAADWLRVQPPAAREVVVIGDIREGALSPQDLDVLDTNVGIRFVPTARDQHTQVPVLRSIAEGGGERPAVFDLRVVPDLVDTRVQYAQTSGAAAPAVKVIAAPHHQGHADALLRAVLREGVVFAANDNRSVTFVFADTPPAALTVTSPSGRAWIRRVLERNPDVRGEEAAGGLVVWTAMMPTDERAVSIIASVLRDAFAPDLELAEPRRVSAATLTGWSRPVGASPADALPADEGDRRWFWGSVLVLLAIEQVVRRRNRRV